jgi:hypothetical protein
MMTPHWAGRATGILGLQATAMGNRRSGTFSAEGFVLDLNNPEEGKQYEGLIHPLIHPERELAKGLIDDGQVLQGRVPDPSLSNNPDVFHGSYKARNREVRINVGVTLFDWHRHLEDVHEMDQVGGFSREAQASLFRNGTESFLGGKRKVSWQSSRVYSLQSESTHVLARVEFHQHGVRTTQADLEKISNFADLIGKLSKKQTEVTGSKVQRLVRGDLGTTDTDVVVTFNDEGISRVHQSLDPDRKDELRMVYGQVLMDLTGRVPPLWALPIAGNWAPSYLQELTGLKENPDSPFVRLAKEYVEYERLSREGAPVEALEAKYCARYGSEFSLRKDAHDYFHFLRVINLLKGNVDFSEIAANDGMDFWFNVALFANLAGPEGFRVEQLSVHGKHAQLEVVRPPVSSDEDDEDGP